jgi:molecular chaperone GrpE
VSRGQGEYVSRKKGTPIAEHLGKVARWAGIGNNDDDERVRSDDAMAEETLVQSVDGVHEGPDNDREAEAAGDAGSANELEQLRGERDQLLDRLARLQAEFENARRRETKERADMRDYALQNAVEPFLGVMDNFQLALKAEGTAEQLRAGVELILKQMEEALRGLNVQAVETVGTQFDPRVHEALGSIETAEYPDHQVLEEIRKGYRIREKLLRPALVRIASNTAQVAE